MHAIGGYFELELKKGDCIPHSASLMLNSGRCAFEYILLANRYRKVHIPYFTCDVLLEPILKHGIEYEFYSIDDNLEPLSIPDTNSDEAFLYTNYFGIKNSYISELTKKENLNLIIDNAQSFYSEPEKEVDTFYSPRKFFGLPDGGLAYCNKRFEIENYDQGSIGRMSHLLIRLDLEPEEGYSDFSKNDSDLIGKDLAKMSLLTRKLLGNIDFESARKIRKLNFEYLQHYLGDSNLLLINNEDDLVPLVYPLRTRDANLRTKLLKNRIFTPKYWPNVADWTKGKSWESQLTEEIVCLPVDQRYDEKDMQTILNFIDGLS